MAATALPPALVDSHAHLDDEAFAADRADVLARARAAGVTRIVSVGADLASSRANVALAASTPGVWASVGVHPHEAAGLNEAAGLDEAALAELRSLAAQPRVVAIGEIGLDFYRDLSPRPAQQAAFRAQLALARELGLPAIVHDREAHDEVLAVLREWAGAYPAARGVLHCFSGDEALARAAIELGFYISLAGPVTYANARRLQSLAAILPLERLLVETDCPYLTPVPRRGQRNEPALVALVAEKVAALRGLAPADLAAATTANARRLFGLVA
ncbi:MAG: TatD family hydrolase [Chloroflexota bacterium]